MRKPRSSHPKRSREVAIETSRGPLIKGSLEWRKGGETMGGVLLNGSPSSILLCNKKDVNLWGPVNLPKEKN